MALRKHRPGELVIEQTRDLVLVREILAGAAMMIEGIEWPAACYIIAYNGDDAIGVVGVEAKIDAALIRSLYVKPAMRQRGIGAALLAAARKAAHTRGARHLYLFSTEAGGFFEKQGFAIADVASVVAALSGVPQVDHYRARPEELAREVAYYLDISGDGMIER